MSGSRDEMRRLLKSHPDVEIAAEARDADEPETLMASVGPDVLFLDMPMPGCSRFELLERLDEIPLVVFTTAYDRFALKAFEVSALDYLLKPVPRTFFRRHSSASESNLPPAQRIAWHRSRRFLSKTGTAAGWFRSKTSSCSKAKATTRVCTLAMSAR